MKMKSKCFLSLLICLSLSFVCSFQYCNVYALELNSLGSGIYEYITDAGAHEITGEKRQESTSSSENTGTSQVTDAMKEGQISYILKNKFDKDSTSVVGGGTSTIVVDKGTINTKDLLDITNIAKGFQNLGGVAPDYSLSDKNAMTPNADTQSKWGNKAMNYITGGAFNNIIGSFPGFTFTIPDGFNMGDDFYNKNWGIVDYPTIGDRYNYVYDYINYAGIDTDINVYHIIEYKMTDAVMDKKHARQALDQWYLSLYKATSATDTGCIVPENKIAEHYSINRVFRVRFPEPGYYAAINKQVYQCEVSNVFTYVKCEYFVIAETGQVIYMNNYQSKVKNNVSSYTEVDVPVGTSANHNPRIDYISEAGVASIWTGSGLFIEFNLTERIE